ncbi:hypothetical protein E4P38_02775 [Blastococcus sp. CT_GayMR16]|nr:hypothetical protein E4P38_02775 [Blastococcus sp. CT_GayMR16]
MAGRGPAALRRDRFPRHLLAWVRPRCPGGARGGAGGAGGAVEQGSGGRRFLVAAGGLRLEPGDAGPQLVGDLVGAGELSVLVGQRLVPVGQCRGLALHRLLRQGELAGEVCVATTGVVGGALRDAGDDALEVGLRVRTGHVWGVLVSV